MKRRERSKTCPENTVNLRLTRPFSRGSDDLVLVKERITFKLCRKAPDGVA